MAVKVWLVAVLVAVGFASVGVSAQTISFRLDLGSLGWGILQQPISIETDGNPATQEWLIGLMFTNTKRVVAVQPSGAICAGPWFEATLEWTLQLVNGRSKLTRMAWPTFEIMDLAHPVC